MTAADRSTLLAIAALLKTPSTIKGPTRRYGEDELKAAVFGAGARLASSTFTNPIGRA
ncbi:hypothetical protein [Methylorubrum sp. SL192]|uniref:hypothetical protein n=1 Tax=Methylorubrum sp. SL192 TaxID=2995167 RepID=UPI000A88CF15|nr:hypothetical protein [Methylorubrum sp. SL192]MCY1644935.1 hypothetical protein [Methylorubrum sp. SL192]